MHRTLVSAALAAVLHAATVPAYANTDASPPPAVTQSLGEPRLAGEGDLRWFGLRVYTAQLWVGRPGLRVDRLASAPFALELRYATSLKGSAIAERSVQEIERMGYGDPARRTRWGDAMKRLFPDVARGDRLTGVHEPGRGARFFHNDRPLGIIEDTDFANAFFAIWLDERTVAPSLREALLKQAADGGGAR
ncbi:MAG: chalcone isomerase family protein [Burkholderiales bacterium]|jgi:hypothetical protein